MKFWCSQLPETEKHEALKMLASGRPIVATYGLSVGLNLAFGNRRVRGVVLMGLPYSASSAVQAASRIRDGGTVKVFVWDLAETAASAGPAAELATLLLTDDIDGIFDLFSPGSIPAVPLLEEQSGEVEPGYNEIRDDAQAVKYMDENEEDLYGTCGICRGLHFTNRCHELHGKCFSCGLSGHGSKSCKLRADIPAVRDGFCSRCKLPLFEVAGVQIHRKDQVGQDCGRTALADLGKMLLLCGKVGGDAFGPPSYAGRLEWATQGRGPNIVTLLARAARSESATPATLLRKRPASPGPASRTSSRSLF